MGSAKTKDAIDGQVIYYKSSEEMSEVEDDSVDAIVTSPPYNRHKQYSADDEQKYDDNKPVDEYFQFLRKVWSECYRVLSPTGVFFLNIGDAAKSQGLSEQVVESAVAVGFIRLQTIIWVKSIFGKGHFTPSGGNRRLNNLWENIFVLVKDKKRYQIFPKDIGIPYADKSNIGRYGESDLRDAGNVWFIPYRVTSGASLKKGHDAPFPVELPVKCARLTRAQRILDPFGGTGSTLAASKLLGIQGIAYEKYPRKEVIRGRVGGDHGFVEEPPTLLPHLEATIELLSETLNKLNLSNPATLFKSTKRECNRLEIVQQTLQNMNLRVDIIDQFLAQPNEDSPDDRQKLRKFLDKDGSR